MGAMSAQNPTKMRTLRKVDSDHGAIISCMPVIINVASPTNVIIYLITGRIFMFKTSVKRWRTNCPRSRIYNQCYL